MQLSEVNDTLWAELATLGVSDGTPAWHGVQRALGVGPGEFGDAATHPVYGFVVAALSVTVEAPSLVLFLLTPGRLIRYEWTKNAALTTTFPIDRVAGVEELESGSDLTIAVQLDTHGRATTSRTEARTVSTDDGTVTITEGTGGTEGLTYRIRMPAETAPILAEFSRRLRLLVGL